MESKSRSLRERHPKRWDVPVVLGTAVLLLPFGLLLPTVTVSRIGGISETDFSVLTGILDLARGGNILLALTILIFSVLFPIVKLTMLWVLWLRRLSPEAREHSLHRLKALGKWSMLDVFVVAVFIGSVQFGALARAYPRHGLYLFFGAVFLSMIATFLELRLARLEPPEYLGKRGPSLAILPVPLLALLFLSAGISLPLMETRKWVFWKTEYSVLSATGAMLREGNYLVAGVVTLFVVLIPIVALTGQMALLLYRRAGKSSGALHAFLSFLDKWTMIDVFALGFLIVVVKIGALADVSPRPGLACFLVGVCLSTGTSWLLKG